VHSKYSTPTTSILRGWKVQSFFARKAFCSVPKAIPA